nr:MAG TPA: hypothetical protein [Caudoviricetes sp.]
MSLGILSVKICHHIPLCQILSCLLPLIYILYIALRSHNIFILLFICIQLFFSVSITFTLFLTDMRFSIIGLTRFQAICSSMM